MYSTNPAAAEARGKSLRPRSDRLTSQSSRMRLTEDEVDAMIETFAKEDDVKRKTWTRIVVEDYLSKVSSCLYTIIQ